MPRVFTDPAFVREALTVAGWLRRCCELEVKSFAITNVM